MSSCEYPQPPGPDGHLVARATISESVCDSEIESIQRIIFMSILSRWRAICPPGMWMSACPDDASRHFLFIFIVMIDLVVQSASNEIMRTWCC